MAPVADNSEDMSGKGLIGNIGNLLGLLVVAFVGALNLFGLRSGELSALLRNKATSVTLIMILTFVALGVALLSLFFSETHKEAGATLLGWLTLCVSLGVIVIGLTPIPGQTTLGMQIACFCAGVLVFFLAWWLLQVGYDRVRWKMPSRLKLWSLNLVNNRRMIWSRKLGLISCSALILSISVLAAGRVETQSQVEAAYPQLDANIAVSKGVGELTLQIKASKMQDGDRINFFVQGFPRDIPMGDVCKSTGEGDCVQALCHDSRLVDGKPDPCKHIGNGIVNADAIGRVDETISTTFSAREYQLLVVEATVCEVKKGKGNVFKNCAWEVKTSILFLNVAES